MIDIGEKAPDFTLPDHTGGSTGLSGMEGDWVVLYFYPRDDTPGCTTEACEFTEGIEQFRAVNAQVVGVSPDTVASHQKFAQKYDLDVKLLSDPDRKVLKAYGAWGEKKMYGRVTQGVIRSTFLIDPQGRVAHHWKNVKAAGHAEKVRQKLEEIQNA